MKHIFLLSTVILFVLSSCAPAVLTNNQLPEVASFNLAKNISDHINPIHENQLNVPEANRLYSELVRRGDVSESNRRAVLANNMKIGMNQYEAIAIAGYPFNSGISSTTTQYGKTTRWNYNKSYGYTYITFDEHNRVEYFSKTKNLNGGICHEEKDFHMYIDIV